MKRLADYKRLLLTAFVLGHSVRDGGKISVVFESWTITITDRVLVGKSTTRRCMFFQDGALVKDVLTEFEVPNKL